MKTVTVLADSASEALAQVYRQLGPAAVILNVRKQAAPGLSRIWKKPQIELKAALPEPQPAQGKNRQALNHQGTTPATSNYSKPKQTERDLAASNLYAQAARRVAANARPAPSQPETKPSVPSVENFPAAELQLSKVLENLGVLPVYAQWLGDQVRAAAKGKRLNSLREEILAVQGFLVQHWNLLAGARSGAEHQTKILVGVPGCGKTTCICKWLTQTVLLQNKKAKVWRLDTHMANTAEFLSIHGEILGVSVDRIWSPPNDLDSFDIQFVDLPGVPVDDPSAIHSLTSQLEMFKPSEVLLVLNAAYDLPHLLSQIKAFHPVQPSGIVLTHLDEESRWSRFWNLLLGAKLPILYLSSGQNIPGHFASATPQALFEVDLEDGVNKELEVSR